MQSFSKATALLGGLALLVTSFIPSAHAASSATTAANATAAVIASISLLKNSDLLFGNVAAGDGTKVIATGDAGAADFTVGGQASTGYSITLPVGAVSLACTGGACTPGTDTLSAGTFTSNPSGTGTLSGAGSQNLKVGATLTVGAAQVAGSYSGSFNVTVTYQ